MKRQRRKQSTVKRGGDRHPQPAPRTSKLPRRPDLPDREAEISARRLRALELRKKGWSYREIAGELNCDLRTAWDDVQIELTALAQLRLREAEGVRQIELERLDAITRALAPKVEAGQIGPTLAYLKCMERRARLLGLDVPLSAGDPPAPPVDSPLDRLPPARLEERLQLLLDRARAVAAIEVMPVQPGSDPA